MNRERLAEIRADFQAGDKVYVYIGEYEECIEALERVYRYIDSGTDSSLYGLDVVLASPLMPGDPPVQVGPSGPITKIIPTEPIE